jgi:hypothetical protein
LLLLLLLLLLLHPRPASQCSGADSETQIRSLLLLMVEWPVCKIVLTALAAIRFVGSERCAVSVFNRVAMVAQP